MKAKTYFAGFVAAASLMASSTVMAADFTGNIGVTSNYIWRGVTQSGDQSAVSGGINYSHNTGFYLDAWTSSLSGGDYELDLKGGYEFKAGEVDLDAGLILYIYPVEQVGGVGSDFTEVYVNGEIKQFAFGTALTISKDGTSDDNDLYLFGTYSLEVKKDLGLALTIGSYNYDSSLLEDYLHFQAALSKNDFTFAIDKNDLNSDGSKSNNGTGSDDFRLSISWTKSIDL